MISLGLFFSGILSLFLVRSHFLLSLISLEFLLLSIIYSNNYSYQMSMNIFILICFFFFCYYDYNFYFVMVYLVLEVCEAVLSLSLVVYLVRSSSLDYLDSLVLV